MIKSHFNLFLVISISFLSPICVADDLIDVLNAEANTTALSENTPTQQRFNNESDDIGIMDKLVAEDSAYLPKNQNEIEYRKTLKSKHYNTYLQYVKLDLKAREHVYEQYAENSFPRIEDTQKAIHRYLKPRTRKQMH